MQCYNHHNATERMYNKFQFEIVHFKVKIKGHFNSWDRVGKYKISHISILQV